MSIIVYFFSRYNEKSLELSKLLAIEDINMKKICVDNENVRKRILDSELDIRKVPTILILHPSQEMEKYSGEECFEWYNYLKQQNIPQNEFNTDRIPVEQIENQPLNDNKLLDDVIRREDTQTINNENEELKASLKINKGNDTEGILMRAQKMQKERDFLGSDNKQPQLPNQPPLQSPQPPLQSPQPPLQPSQPPLQPSQPPLQPPLQSSQPPL